MMYKLQNGELITPPTVWKGVAGYNNNLSRLMADGWKPLVTTGKGEEITYIEHADYIEEQHSKPKYDYRALRAAAYPELGDVVDAICKAYEGDDTELSAILAQRNIVKSTIKKVQDAD